MSVLAEGQFDTCEHEFRAERVNVVKVRRSRGQRIRRCIKRDLKRLFLKSYAHTGNVSRTCRELLIARNTVYTWMKRDTAFSDRYRAIVNRLYPSWEPPALGNFEAEIRAMSDRALMAALTRMQRRKGMR